MSKKITKELMECANELDQMNHYAEADKITRIALAVEEMLGNTPRNDIEQVTVCGDCGERIDKPGTGTFGVDNMDGPKDEFDICPYCDSKNMHPMFRCVYCDQAFESPNDAQNCTHGDDDVADDPWETN